MRYEVDFDPQAVADLRAMRAFKRAAIIDQVGKRLESDPTRTSRTSIKRLRGLDSPQYRLRVGDSRVFYDVSGDQVYVLRVLAKSDVDEYLKEMGHEA